MARVSNQALIIQFVSECHTDAEYGPVGRIKTFFKRLDIWF